MIPHILTGQSLTVLLDGRTVAVPRSHVNFEAILEVIPTDDVDALRALIDVKAAITSWTNGRIEVVERELRYNGAPLNTTLTQKIVDFIRDGDERLAEPLCNFLDKVMQNPSFRAAQGLYDWVAASEMPIHPDGDILAWKIVKPDFHDYYTGRFDHSPGKIVEQPRNQCDENPDQTCSHGIHFCSFKYLPHYGHTSERKIMLVKINPADVVAIPTDYNTAKGRCCRLEVLLEVPEPDGFFPTRTVYFEEPAKPKFEVGQKWRDNDGDTMEILEVDEDTNRVTAEFGHGEYTFDLEGKSIPTGYLRLVDLIEEAPEPVVEAPTFEVGQSWICRDGKVRKIVGHGWISPTYGPTLETDDGKKVWAKTGGPIVGRECPMDLITLVKPIDWTKPIETVTGVSVRFGGFDTYDCKTIALVHGNFHDVITGEHLFGIASTVRNVT